MNLQDIATRYQQNLLEIFSNEKVIEAIYIEQYGKQTYMENQDSYNESFKQIMSKTMFIPYITLDHLQNLIEEIKRRHGEKYLFTNYKELYSLYRKLINIKTGIIKDYTKKILEDIKEKMPRVTGLDELLQECTNESPEFNVEIIEAVINKSNRLSKLQRNRLSKILQSYQKGVREKILIETSSFFLHRSEMTNNQYYASILEGMLSGGQFVEQRIGRNPEKNYRYVFLPVLQYRTEEQYLKNAFHEVMHISKEQILPTRYRTGLLERIIPLKGAGLLGNDNPKKNFFEHFIWKLFKKKSSYSKEKYHSYLGESFIEETSHHWQVRNVVENIMNSKDLPPIHMLYRDEKIQEGVLYENADEITALFMDAFGEKVQEVNSGKTTIRGFKRMVGNLNFKLLGSLYNEWLTHKNITLNRQFGCSSLEDIDYEGKAIYSELGRKIIYRMCKRSQRNIILSRTAGIMLQDICDISDLIKDYFKRTPKKSSVDERVNDEMELGG